MTEAAVRRHDARFFVCGPSRDPVRRCHELSALSNYIHTTQLVQSLEQENFYWYFTLRLAALKIGCVSTKGGYFSHVADSAIGMAC